MLSFAVRYRYIFLYRKCVSATDLSGGKHSLEVFGARVRVRVVKIWAHRLQLIEHVRNPCLGITLGFADESEGNALQAEGEVVTQLR